MLQRGLQQLLCSTGALAGALAACAGCRSLAVAALEPILMNKAVRTLAQNEGEMGESPGDFGRAPRAHFTTSSSVN